ncbi:MAG TPA: UDP-N-acetylmuramate--L-alanine ligase [Gemmatimonadaceae bacterium]|nr:UDP-N-acetylmuramate--L-alanine ligase [Gemmatimonadaceae bacterium]
MLLDSSDTRPVHFVGVAGAGMSALAELFVRRGVRVTGCDANPGDVEDLRALGIDVVRGHDPAHVREARALVVTSAMPKDHPELLAARDAGLPVIRRAEALGEATSGDGRELIGVAGTHGKSTTTMLVAEALAAAGRDPTALVGARVPSWNGNLRAGSDRLYVVEADEYDRSFLALSPTVAIVTNIEADHLDIYRDLADINDAFARFVRGARHIALCADDAGATSLRTPSAAEVIRYAIDSQDARLHALNVRVEDGRTAFSVDYDGDLLGSVSLRLPGRHNVLNALGAIASGLAIGAPFEGLAYGLANVTGAERRFQRIGEEGGILVLDDYAHHPTEIAATIAAARASLPGRRLVVAFQPHLYSRTRDFASQFAEALAGADVLYLTEIYAAREKPIPGITTSLIVDAMGSLRSKLAWRGNRDEVADALSAGVREGDVVITMGAGDITKTAAELLTRLRRAA